MIDGNLFKSNTGLTELDLMGEMSDKNEENLEFHIFLKVIRGQRSGIDTIKHHI